MEKKKALLIVNPKAGQDKTRKNTIDIVERLSIAGYDFTVRNTTCAGDATNIVKQYSEGHDVIVCCGGDGTLNEVINGVMSLDHRVKVGYIPMGSTNDLANTIGIPSDLGEAASLIAEGHTNSYDIGMFNNKFFSYVASFGAGVDMSYSTPQALKNLLGYKAYLLNGFVLHLPQNLKNVKPRHMRFEYDGGVIDDNFFFGAISNSTSVGGIFKYDKNDVKLDDGVFEVILVRKLKKPIDAFSMLHKIQKREYDGDTLIYLKTKTARFTFDKPEKWTLDGEYGGEVLDAHVNILPRALQIFSGENPMFLGDIAQPVFVREEKPKKKSKSENIPEEENSRKKSKSDNIPENGVEE